MTSTNEHDGREIGDDLVITKTTLGAGSGTWVSGRLNGHRFYGLIVPEHAENPEHPHGSS